MKTSPVSVPRFLPLKFRHKIMNASETQLKGLSEVYSVWGERFAYAVVAGVALELIASLIPLPKELAGPLRAPIPDALILIGVAGEVLCGNRLRIASERLAEFSEQRVAEANARAAEANLARVKLEARIAPRRLSLEQQERMVSELSKIELRPNSTTVVAVSTTSESESLAEQIETVLRRARWIVVRKRPSDVGADPVAGVCVWSSQSGRSREAADLLREALLQEGIETSHTADLHDPLGLHVYVLVGDHP